MAKFSIGECAIFVRIITGKHQQDLLRERLIRLFVRQANKHRRKLLDLYKPVFVDIKHPEHLKQVEARFHRKLTLDLLGLFFHVYLVLEEAGELFPDFNDWNLLMILQRHHHVGLLILVNPLLFGLQMRRVQVLDDQSRRLLANSGRFGFFTAFPSFVLVRRFCLS